MGLQKIQLQLKKILDLILFNIYYLIYNISMIILILCLILQASSFPPDRTQISMLHIKFQKPKLMKFQQTYRCLEI